jgi:murein DD-endopeptidase MepM/ murein hydrolase activator NlpD
MLAVALSLALASAAAPPVASGGAHPVASGGAHPVASNGARPDVRLAPAAARPGDAVLVSVAGPADAPPHGTLAGRRLAFWRDADGWRALAALPLEARVGEVSVDVEAEDARAAARLAIVEPGFPSKQIRGVPEKYVAPPPEVKARMEADRAAVAAAYARPFGPPLFRGGFAWPREARLSGRFGDQRVLNGEKATVHYGTDVTGPRGAPILAANDGEVALVRDAYLSGNTVILAHGAGVFTAYFHLDRIDVRPGQRVARGEQIGRLGGTGRATGPHLHWSARVDGLYVDPESLLAIDFRAGTAPPRAPRLPPPPVDAPRPPDLAAPAGASPAISGSAPAPRR